MDILKIFLFVIKEHNLHTLFLEESFKKYFNFVPCLRNKTNSTPSYFNGYRKGTLSNGSA